ncbi:hypothetical protein [Kitasatospora fiedleri]|uniref:hypothetical protein n=1 Tax=Kitasatospora fiedleri TaxID=2991545 RepID=UPI00249AF937|nr:hypothetical protein [Kitasatospora fiedleri]
MTNSLLDQLDHQRRALAQRAYEGVQEALRSAGIRLPSLAVEKTVTGEYLVQLGGVVPDVAGRLASVAWTGAPYLRAAEGEEFAEPVMQFWTPEQGELLVEVGTERLGEFSRMNESGELVLIPADGGEPWSVGRTSVRHPRVDDLVRAGFIRPRASRLTG